MTLKEKESLKECIKHLEKPDKNTSAICRQKLQFSDQKSPKIHFNKTPKQLEYFHSLFPSKVFVTKSIIVKSNNKFDVPNSLQKQLKSKKLFTLTPIFLCDTSDVYGLLQDTEYQIWTIFRLPGSNVAPNSDTIELKIRKLLTEYLKLKVDIFYHNINSENEPKKGSIDYPWWPSWLIYLTLKRIGSERERIINSAQAKVLTRDKEYIKFVTDYISSISKL